MLVTGVYRHGYTLVFQLIKGLKGYSLALFHCGANNSAEDWVVNSLGGRVTKVLEPYLVSHTLLKMNYDIRAFAGDLELTEEFLKEFLSCVDIGALWYDAEYRATSKGSDGVFINFKSFNSSYAVVNKWKFVKNYQEVSKKENLQYLARLQGVRSLEQLKMIYDLSWILDENDQLKRDYRCITTEEELDEVVRTLGDERYQLVGFDTETTGVDVFYLGGKSESRDKILGFSLSWKKGQAVYVPLESNKFKCLNKDQVIPKIFPILEKKKLIMANGSFDIRVAYDLGYNLSIFFDTMIAQYDLDPKFSKGRKSLKFMSREYLGEQTLELDEVLGGSVDGRLIKDLDKEVITIYGCADAEQLLRLYPILRKELIDGGLVNCFTNDMKLVPITSVAEYYSVKLDVKLLKSLKEINERDLKSLTEFMNAYLIQVTRAKVIREVFFDQPEIQNQLRALREEGFKDEEVVSELMKNPESQKVFEAVKSDKEVLRCIRSMAVKHNKEGKEIPWNYSSPVDVSFILYELLEYPVTKINKKKKVSRDNEALEALCRQKTGNSRGAMKEDLLSCVDEYGLEFHQDKVLLSAERFNQCKYPFAYALQTWRELDKLKTGFYESLDENRIGEYRCTTNNMTAADTARIINPIQTLKKDLKRLVVCPSDDYYMIDFDAAQIEFRVMIGLASVAWSKLCESLGDKCSPEFKEHDISYLVERLNLPWADYHREGGAALVGTTPAKMTKSQRSRVKAPHFAIPYGGEAPTIAKDKLVGVTDPSKRRQILFETEEILDAWKNKMFPLYWFLETIRDQAITPVQDKSKLSPILRERVAEGEASGIKRQYGMIRNGFGRRIYYNLSYEEMAVKWWESDQEALREEDRRSSAVMKEKFPKEWKRFVSQTERSMNSIIRRAAGNYPIQSFAREIFVKMMLNLRKELVLRGYSGQGPGKEKVIQNVFIHDENLLLVHKSIHPFEMYEIIRKACMLEIPGHPKYYCGVSVVNTWYDAKDDSLEAPIEFLDAMIERFKENREECLREDWQSDPVSYVKGKITEWIREYCDKELSKWVKNGVLDLDEFREHNENYFLLIRPVLHTDSFKFDSSLGLSKEECCCLQHLKDKSIVVKWGDKAMTLRELGFDKSPENVDKSPESVDKSPESVDKSLESVEQTSEFSFSNEELPAFDLDSFDFFDLDEDIKSLREEDSSSMASGLLEEDIVFEDLQMSEENLNESFNDKVDEEEFSEEVHKPIFCLLMHGELHVDLSKCRNPLKSYEAIHSFLGAYKSEGRQSMGVVYHANFGTSMEVFRVKPDINVALISQILTDDFDSTKKSREVLE